MVSPSLHQGQLCHHPQAAAGSPKPSPLAWAPATSHLHIERPSFDTDSSSLYLHLIAASHSPGKAVFPSFISPFQPTQVNKFHTSASFAYLQYLSSTQSKQKCSILFWTKPNQNLKINLMKDSIYSGAYM